MNEKIKQTREFKTSKLREFFETMADEICRMQDKVILSFTGNTFEINLEGASVNITINESAASTTKGGRQ